MNQRCKVCGEPAAGFHFGAFTCEGCKSFFGRSYNNLNTISECRNNGECVIDKKNRTACKACRLRKCLLVGMSKGGSRYGRRSNWFKIHCLLQEQQQAAIASFREREKSSPDNNLHLLYQQFPHSETSSPDSNSSEKGSPPFFPLAISPMLFRSPFLGPPYPYPLPTPPQKPAEPLRPPIKEEIKTPSLNNNNYDSRNNNLQKDPRRFYLDSILGLKCESSSPPPVQIKVEEEGQDNPIDLSLPKTPPQPCEPSISERVFPCDEVKAIPLDLSV